MVVIVLIVGINQHIPTQRKVFLNSHQSAEHSGVLTDKLRNITYIIYKCQMSHFIIEISFKGKHEPTAR